MLLAAAALQIKGGKKKLKVRNLKMSSAPREDSKTKGLFLSQGLATPRPPGNRGHGKFARSTKFRAGITQAATDNRGSRHPTQKGVLKAV